MSIAAVIRERDVAIQRRWYAMTGVPQMDLTDRDMDQGRWTLFAQCGPYREHVDPELFFPVEADSDQTYAAQEICARCPVREACGEQAARERRAGVWGGISRDALGRAAPLCGTPGCLRYRMHGKDHCRACYAAEAAAAKAAETVSEVIAA